MALSFAYQLIRSKRRTIGLEIRDNGELIVRAPKYASKTDIETLIQEKQRWILRHQTKIKQQKLHTQPKQFVNGELFLYLGQHYPLWLNKEMIQPLQFDNAFYLAEAYQPQAAKLFLQWYYQQAQHIINERTKFYAEQAGLCYQGIRINNPKRQWGACSAEGKLSFNWRLIMAPLKVVDYVVAHELAHLVWRNHSSRFWRKVENIYPEFQPARKWLRENGNLLIL